MVRGKDQSHLPRHRSRNSLKPFLVTRSTTRYFLFYFPSWKDGILLIVLFPEVLLRLRCVFDWHVSSVFVFMPSSHAFSHTRASNFVTLFFIIIYFSHSFLSAAMVSFLLLFMAALHPFVALTGLPNGRPVYALVPLGLMTALLSRSPSFFSITAFAYPMGGLLFFLDIRYSLSPLSL